MADADAERLERLIASNEAQANAITRLVQVLERKEQRRVAVKAGRVRREPTRTVQMTERAERVAKQALARIRAGR